MTEYRISAETLTSLADRVRVLTGISTQLTPGEMIAHLGQVKVLGEARAACSVSMNIVQITTNATGEQIMEENV